MAKINFSGYDWLIGERFGIFKTGLPWMWFSESNVKITRLNELVLSISKTPKLFEEELGKKYNPQWAVGYLTCETNFHFGKFEIEAILPEGNWLWPAFWLYDSRGWKPEIDIFEGYSMESNYRNWFLKPYHIESCLHMPDKSLKPQSPWCWNTAINPTKQFNRYSLIWTAELLEWQINGVAVRQVTDKAILLELAKHEMRVILNNAIDGKNPDKATSETPFIIKNFKYDKFN